MRSAIKGTTQLSLPLRASEVYSASEVIPRIVKFRLWRSRQTQLHFCGSKNFTQQKRESFTEFCLLPNYSLFCFIVGFAFV